jgi:hypothetical protein
VVLQEFASVAVEGHIRAEMTSFSLTGDTAGRKKPSISLLLLPGILLALGVLQGPSALILASVRTQEGFGKLCLYLLVS